MVRARHSWNNPRTLLAAACALAMLLAILPWRLTAWVQGPANLLSIFVSPLQNGFTKVLSPVAVRRGPYGPGGAGGADFEVVRTRYLQLENENRQLRAQIESLQNGVRITGDLGTPRVIAGSLGLRGSLLQLRTDHVALQPDGQSPIGSWSVVVLEGVNLIGRVVSPGAKVTLAQLVADPAGSEVRGVIRPQEDDIHQSAPASQAEYGVKLKPTSEGGRLSGEVYLLSKPAANGAAPEPVKPGCRVRLADPAWPRFAQMLIVGEVESVSAAQNSRPVVTVRPMYNVRELAGAEFTVLIQPPLADTAPVEPPVSPGQPAGRGGKR